MIQVFGLGFQSEFVALTANGGIVRTHDFIRTWLWKYAIPKLASPGGFHHLPEGGCFPPALCMKPPCVITVCVFVKEA